MRRFPELRPNGWDGLVAGAVLALALCTVLLNWKGGENDGLSAVISVDGEVQETVELTALRGPEERILTANGYTLHVMLSPEEVWVESSDCPTQDCVHTGHIRSVGRSIVCLPARISIQLEGVQRQDGLDAVIG